MAVTMPMGPGARGTGRNHAARSLSANLLLAALSTVVALLAAEVALRAFVPHVRGSHLHPTRVLRDDFLTDGRLGQHHELLGWTIRPNVTVTHRGREFKHSITTNSRGLRDDEVAYERTPGERRILILGDSFMMGDGVERRDLFADRLESTLRNTEVVNAGVSGYGTDQELLYYLTEGKKYGADVVLLALTLDNDFLNNSRPKQYGLAKPYYVPVGEGLQLRGTPVPQSPLQQSASLPDSLTRSPFPVHDFLDGSSALYAALFNLLARIPALRQRWEAGGLLYARENVFYSGQVGILSTKLSADQADAWRITLQLLGIWQAEVRRQGSQPVLFLIPSHIQVYPEVWRRVVAEYDLQTADFDPDYPNRRLREFGQAIGLAVIDPTPDFRAAVTSGRDLYYKQNPHWNREGHALAAEVVARELGRLGLAP
jgi:hypothetical protein